MRQVEGSSKPSGTEMQSRSKEERSLWDHWSRLRIIGGTLFLMDDLGPKVITPISRVPGVLQAVHQQLGHAGQLKTETAIRQRYWWLGIHTDVVKLCNASEICAAITSKTPLSRAPLEPIVATSPGQRVGVDLMGPLPVTRNGNRHLVLIDYFTKWWEAIPIKNPDAATVASAIVNVWIARYGAPLSLHSDQGAVFESPASGSVGCSR
ncbi:unnamed protein product [Dicrocoelium dendriticum]|nr:unnamed protein product [Dicrocoelium dendriticum]